VIEVLPPASATTARRHELSPLAAGLLAIAGNILAVAIVVTAGLLVLAAGAVIFGSALLDLV
jgi:hypothetical protein